MRTEKRPSHECLGKILRDVDFGSDVSELLSRVITYSQKEHGKESYKREMICNHASCVLVGTVVSQRDKVVYVSGPGSECPWLAEPATNGFDNVVNINSAPSLRRQR